jgi:hypothetical protein
MKRSYWVSGLLVAALFLVVTPAIAFSSSQYQQQANSYINNHCKTKVADIVALRCFLYSRTQELGQSVTVLGGRLTNVETEQIPRIDNKNVSQDTSINNLSAGLEEATDLVNDIQGVDGTQDTALDELSTKLSALQDDVLKLNAPATATGSPKIYSSTDGGALIGTLVGGVYGGDFDIFVPSKSVFVKLDWKTGQNKLVNHSWYQSLNCEGDVYMVSHLVDYYGYGTSATSAVYRTEGAAQEFVPKSVRFPGGGCSNQPGPSPLTLVRMTPIDLPFSVPAGKLVVTP